MIKEKKESSKKPTIDLTGPDGNAFFLLGKAKSIYMKVGEEHFKLLFGVLSWDEIKVGMTSGDYENLIQTFDKYFGSFVDLER